MMPFLSVVIIVRGRGKMLCEVKTRLKTQMGPGKQKSGRPINQGRTKTGTEDLACGLIIRCCDSA